ncbi:TetR/AcrR family transcriptional regulator [Aquisediminimonas profunda]|uniref:TetR/AcrR family transcriptional regulator n=1 Tax=Aquisediminimonas profunda TaxID=1550733 RepID=UPI001C6299CD|nr:TetR/AcrR family transcriptional regulator [Aquisediminimonas profunda]
MDAARQVFSEMRYTHARVQDVTECAGFSLGAFYRYFSDKDDILFAIVSIYFDQAYATTFLGARYDPSNPMQSLRKSTVQTIEFSMENRNLIKILWETSQFNRDIEEQWSELRSRIYRKIARLITRAQEDNIGCPGIDPIYTAELLTCMTEHAVYRKLVLPSKIPAREPENLTEHLVNLWARVLFLPQVWQPVLAK